MNDLIGAHARLAEVYRMYVESAFPFRYPVLDSERRSLLANSGMLAQEPLVEPVPIYTPSEYTIRGAADRMGAEFSGLSELGANLFPKATHLYRHQWDALEAVVNRKKDIVVTTGTGSGKTECFLLPLLAELSRESLRWQPCEDTGNRYWWRENGERISQWAHCSRPHAIRALIMYPLNALVEDQLRRLRMTFDSPRTHAWMDECRGKNRVLFGRYTSQTPVPGAIADSAALSRLRKSLRHLDSAWQKVEASLQQEGVGRDLRYHFARIDGGEMWSRWDIHETPPDVFITNYSMLNIMLMREIESRIFTQTKQWLQTDARNEFFLIVDELHSYRGTPGTEIAYVLRLFLDRIGLSPESDQLRILTTSASLEKGESSKKFLREFFGRSERFEFICGDQVRPLEGARLFLRPHAAKFETFAKKVQADPLDTMMPPNLNTDASQRAIRELAVSLGGQEALGESPVETLGRVLSTNKCVDAIRDACCASNGQVRATRASDLDRLMFETNADSNSMRTSDALRGFLVAMSVARKSDGLALQSVRGHLFFHNLENLWVCTNPDCTDESCVGREYLHHSIRPTCGALLVHHRLACSCGGRVLDLVICSSCGDIFFGGFSKTVKSGQQSGMILTPDQPELEQLPDKATHERTHGEYAVFWPSSDDPVRQSYQHNHKTHRWTQASLDIVTGVVQKTVAVSTDGKVEGWLYVVNDKETDAKPPICPRCDADFRRSHAISPLRQHRTGFQRCSQVLASALAREMPESQNDTRGRKLVIFSDSRQDAAKLAAGMELDHFRDMVRVCLIGAHQAFFNVYVRVVSAICHKSPSLLEIIAKMNSQLASDIRGFPADLNEASAVSSFNASHPGLASNLMQVAFMGGSFDKENTDIIWGYPTRVPLRHIRGIVWERLILIGNCPGGTRADCLVFDDDRQKKQWWECFDWTVSPTRVNPKSPAEVQHIVRMQNALMKELVFCLFPHATRTFESLGLGFATFRYPDATPPILVEACQAIIRCLCERKNFRHWPDFVFDPQGQAQKLQRSIRKYLNDVGLEPPQVEDFLRVSGLWLNGENNPGIDSDNLWLEIPMHVCPSTQPNPGWNCPRCGAFYMHRAAGRCIDCNVELCLSNSHVSLDYYRYLAEKAGNGFRFHSEELTGQTDGADKPNRQRWFQEVFLTQNGEIPAIHGIDLLSVTTTMESGVDIGSLLSVMLANVPPRRFNYQQRVGRAGRRGTGLSLAVTFCRGRSHDEFYYQRPEKITGDPPPPPYIDTRQLSILKRVLAKEILREAFCSLPEQSNRVENVHGEFGAVEQWHEVRPSIERFIVSDFGVQSLDRDIRCLTFATYWTDDRQREAQMQAEVRDYVRNKLLDRIDDACADGRFHKVALSECIASAGILPMFGFPTRVRPLFTNIPTKGNPWPPEHGTVDRDLDIAISQFAPGSETVKDKRVYTAAGIADFIPAGNAVMVRPGFVPPIMNEQQELVGNTLIGVCRSCQAVVYLEQVEEPLPGGIDPEPRTCPVCKDINMFAFDAREPKGFFCCQSKDFDGTFEWVPRATRPMVCVSTDRLLPVHETNLTTASLSSEILSINDNGGQGGFDFHPVTLQRVRGLGAYAVNPYSWSQLGSPSYRISLLSRRLTDIMIMDILKWPGSIYADPMHVSGRAAWYSLAFLLRTAATTLLDVDVQELQAGIRTLESEGTPRGQAFLSDSLENGAGYCLWLAEEKNIQNVLSSISNDRQTGPVTGQWLRDEHVTQCDTSCSRCLRDYYNMPYHGLLDWRLALDMAQIAAGVAADCDINRLMVASYENRWRPLANGERSPIGRILAQFGYQPTGSSLAPVFASKRRKRALIACHPLWTPVHHDFQAALVQTKEDHPDFEVEAMDLFVAIRRPADYV